MSILKIQGEVVPVHLWAEVHDVESQALTQLKNIAKLPWVFKHIAVMPDVHYGIGATVGSVIAMKGAVAPAAVGVDIGCGMAAVKTSLTASDLPDSLQEIFDDISRAVPVGFASHDKPTKHDVYAIWASFGDLHEKVQDLQGRARKQLGTLGGGNHFIELCLDREQRVWIMLHSGSRNIGKVLAEIHIEKARQLAHNQALPDRDLAVFLSKTPEMEAYRRDLMWAQGYAMANRQVMMRLVKDVVLKHFAHVSYGEPVYCHHNYLSEETHFGEEVFVTRKGAIRARKGDFGIIPGSMGTRSYIVEGLGNPESFHSASHGAGRVMSRGAAKRSLTIESLEKATEGVCCRKDAGVLDEHPDAYKSIDQVMANQSDLVRIVAELKQVLCVKG